MHEFAGLEEVAAALDALAGRAPEPLVARLARKVGFKEQRYTHLLCGEPPAPAAAPEPQREAVDPGTDGARLARLEAEGASLRAEVEELRRQLAELRGRLG